MKKLLTMLCSIALGSMASCAEVGVTRPLKGHPIYKFITLGGVDEKSLRANEARFKEILGEAYESYVKQHALFVAHGFDCHTPLRIRVESGAEIEVFVRDDDYKLLWKTSPHELSAQKKSHLVTIKFVEVKVGEVMVKRAVEFRAELVDKEPVIRK